MKRSSSLRRRLLLALMLMTLLTLAIASGLSAVMDLRLFRDHMLRDLKVLAAVVGESCVSSLVFNSKGSAEQRLATLAGEYQIRTATLYDNADRPFANWQRQADGMPAGTGEEVKIAHALQFDGHPIGRLVLSARLDELQRQMWTYLGLVVSVVLVTLAAALAFAWHLQQRISRPITALENAARAVSEKGDFSVRVPPLQAVREIDSLVQSFNRMLAEIAQRDGELREANAALRGLATDLSLLEDTEKTRLADELHDGPMQTLALAQIQIDASAVCDRTAHSDRIEAEQQLAAGIQLMREAIAELRTLQFALSPPILRQQGLAAALHWLADDAHDRWGIQITCSVATALPALDHRQTVILFRCARELVNNLIKHADARVATIELRADGETVQLAVADDGRGFNGTVEDGRRANCRGGYGLLSIRERLELLGGRLEIHSSRAGSRLVVHSPLSENDETRKRRENDGLA